MCEKTVGHRIAKKLPLDPLDSERLSRVIDAVEMDGAQAAQMLYRRVAEASLAYWIDGTCKSCSGTGNQGCAKACASCAPCSGTGKAVIVCSGGFERERIKDMVSELESISIGHAGRASQRLHQ